MRQSLRIVSLCLLATMLLGILCGCNVSEDNVIGTWTGSYTFNGNSYTVCTIIDASGAYSKVTVKNGLSYTSETGDWEIKGSKIYLYDDSSAVHHGEATVYTYSNGQLDAGSCILDRE